MLNTYKLYEQLYDIYIKEMSREETIDLSYKYHQCCRCDEKLDITEIKATGHKWNTYYTIDVEP